MSTAVRVSLLLENTHGQTRRHGKLLFAKGKMRRELEDFIRKETWEHSFFRYRGECGTEQLGWKSKPR